MEGPSGWGAALDVTVGARADRPPSTAHSMGAGTAPASTVPWAGIARVGSHLCVWLAVVVSTLIELDRGWRAAGDNAAISIQAWDVFSRHSPLVGGYSSSSGGGHVLHDLGPLLSWMLAVPVHVDPAHGLLWGGAIWCGAGCSLAVEALWRTIGWVGSVAFGVLVADLFWLAPGVAGNLGWNPNVALVFLSSAVALSWVVASGSIGWWPALVAVASVAAQCHLFYAIVAVLLVLGAPLICLLVAGRPSSWRWLLGGAAVGLVCWWAPVVQQLTGHPGNLSELLAHGRQGRAAGIRFGLDQMARGALRPTWATGPPSPTASPAAGVGSSGAVVGVLLLLSGAAVAGWARRRRQPSLAALVAVWAVLAGGLALSFSALPRRNLAIYLAYLDNSLVPLGFVAWAIAAWSVLEVVRGRSTQATGPARTGPAPRTPVGRGVLVAGLAIAVGLVAATAGELPSAAATADNTGAAVKVNERVATMVERLVPRGPVGIELEPGLRVDRVYLAWRLVADGWEPGLAPDYDPALCRGPVLEPSLAADCALHLPATYSADAAARPLPAGNRWPLVRLHGTPSWPGVGAVRLR